MFSSSPKRNRKFQKNSKKKSKNYKIPLWLLLKPKFGGKEWGREKIKIIVPFCSNHIRNTKFHKNSKKIQKIKKIPLWLHFKPKLVWKARERGKIKIIVPFRSNQKRNTKFQKNSKKFQKIQNTIKASFQSNIGWKSMWKRENKYYRSVPFLPDP